MLGKRFRRTTSMSQLGPARPAHDHIVPAPQISDKKVQGAQDLIHSAVCGAPAAMEAEARLWVLQGGKQSGADVQWMAHESGRPQLEPCEDTAMISASQSDEEIEPAFDLNPLVPYQMGLWTGTSTHQVCMQGEFLDHGGAAKLLHHIRAEASISPIDFLDVCFFCKRRLKHERDIFIYRGDSAFCSEECRYRQILSDERRLRRGAAGSKRGARASSSETAVAA